MKNLENNKLTAVFMGYELQKDPTERFFGKYKTPITNVWVDEKELSFDTDWNLIMDVVEMIEEIDVVASFQIENPTIYIWKSSEDSNFEDIEIDIFTKTKKEAVVEAINQFISWYNKNNTATPKEPGLNTLVCKECGGNNIQGKEWRYVHSGKFAGDSSNDDDDNWCDDCEAHIEFVTIDEYLQTIGG